MKDNHSIRELVLIRDALFYRIRRFENDGTPQFIIDAYASTMIRYQVEFKHLVKTCGPASPTA